MFVNTQVPAEILINPYLLKLKTLDMQEFDFNVVDIEFLKFL